MIATWVWGGQALFRALGIASAVAISLALIACGGNDIGTASSPKNIKAVERQITDQLSQGGGYVERLSCLAVSDQQMRCTASSGGSGGNSCCDESQWIGAYDATTHSWRAQPGS